MVNYDGMNIQELQGIIRDASEALERKVQARKNELMEEFQKLSEMLPGERVTRKREKSTQADNPPARADGRSKPKPTHQNPDTGETWAGRGQRPKWLQAFIEQGRDADEFRIVE